MKAAAAAGGDGEDAIAFVRGAFWALGLIPRDRAALVAKLLTLMPTSAVPASTVMPAPIWVHDEVTRYYFNRGLLRSDRVLPLYGCPICVPAIRSSDEDRAAAAWRRLFGLPAPAVVDAAVPGMLT